MRGIFAGCRRAATRSITPACTRRATRRAQKLLTLCGYRLEEVLSGEIAALPKRVAALGSTGEVAARIGVGRADAAGHGSGAGEAGARPAPTSCQSRCCAPM